MKGFAHKFLTDARHFQIAAVSALILILTFGGDFGPDWKVLLVTEFSICAFQLLFLWRYNVAKKDLRSAIIAGLSITLLLRTNFLALYVLAAFLVVATKFWIRWEGKHIFNPSNIAIVLCLLLLSDYAWISPGQWGNSILFGFVVAFIAFIVLTKARSADISLFFLGAWAFLTFARALWLGDPLAIPLHQMQSGALLVFAFFMISDPMTIPDHRKGRAIFALVTAAIGFILQFQFQIREGLFYALPIMCLGTPVLDILFKHERTQWRKI